MTKQESVKYISSLINDPATITDGDQSSIALLRQKYPYFVPVRYLLALESHKKSAWSPAMLSAIQPYTGNWLLFCDFLSAGTGDIIAKQEQDEPVSAEEEIIVTSAIPDPGQKEPEQEEVVTEKTGEEPVPDEAAEYTFIAATEDNPFFTQIIEEELTIPAEADAPGGPESTVSNEVATPEATAEKNDEETLITPIHSHDYFLHQGERVSEDLPGDNEIKVIAGDATFNTEVTEDAIEEEDKSLMVMMSFSEWLSHFKKESEKQKEENKDKKALKTMWQKEKLAAAMEEENEEIPENVFEMAVNSISNEEGLASETLANIYIKQGKYDKAIEMYRKLSLRNPQKNVYFARKIDEILKDKQS